MVTDLFTVVLPRLSDRLALDGVLWVLYSVVAVARNAETLWAMADAS